MNTTQQSKVTTIATTATTSNDIKKLDCVTTQLHFLQLPLGNFWRPFFLLALVSLLGGRQRERRWWSFVVCLERLPCAVAVRQGWTSGRVSFLFFLLPNCLRKPCFFHLVCMIARSRPL